jgi:hypothetical protein
VRAAARPTIVCAVVAALFLTACGGGDSTSPATGTFRESAENHPGGGFSRTRGEPKARAGGHLCQSQVGGFLGSMDSLRRRLAVGVTYEQYVDEVKGIGATYRDVPTGALRIDCVSAVGVPAEKAFNRYILALNDWGDCVSEAGCGSAEVEPVLQQRWRAASHFLSEAQAGLRRIEA